MRFTDCIFRSHPTGSRYICNPPVMDTDSDTVILVNGYHDWYKMLIDEDWTDSGEHYDIEGDFRSFRKGQENYIVTEDEDFYWSYVKATEGAKALNLLDKEDRIKLFRAVRGAGRGVYNQRAPLFNGDEAQEHWPQDDRPDELFPEPVGIDAIDRLHRGQGFVVEDIEARPVLNQIQGLDRPGQGLNNWIQDIWGRDRQVRVLGE